MLIRHLPPNDSAVYRKLDPEGYGWNVEAYLLAQLGDLLSVGNWQRANAGAKPGSQTPHPTPMYRPPDVSAQEAAEARQARRIADWRARNCRREDT